MKKIFLFVIMLLSITLCLGQNRGGGSVSRSSSHPSSSMRSSSSSRRSSPSVSRSSSSSSRSSYTPSRSSSPSRSSYSYSSSRSSYTPSRSSSNNFSRSSNQTMSRPSTSFGRSSSDFGSGVNGGRPSGINNNSPSQVRNGGKPNGNFQGGDRPHMGAPQPPRPHHPMEYHPYYCCYHHPYFHHDIYLHRIYWDPFLPDIYVDGLWIYTHEHYYIEYSTRYVYVNSYTNARDIQLIDYVVDSSYTYCIQKEGWSTYFRVFDNNNKLIAQKKIARRYKKLIYDDSLHGVWCLSDADKNNYLFVYDNISGLICYTE